MGIKIGNLYVNCGPNAGGKEWTFNSTSAMTLKLTVFMCGCSPYKSGFLIWACATALEDSHRRSPTLTPNHSMLPAAVLGPVSNLNLARPSRIRIQGCLNMQTEMGSNIFFSLSFCLLV